MFDVTIIGYGPTGQTLANLLAMQGVSVLVLEREANMYDLPRAVHFDDEVMRVFQTIGIADELAKLLHINPGMKFLDAEDRVLLDWPRPQEITKHGWHASYRLHQPDLERLLRAQLQQQETATIVANHEVVAMNETGKSVQISAKDRGAGKTTLFQTRYVVGCDGANSFTRGIIGSGMEDLGFEERWLVVDVLLKRPRPDLGDHSLQYCIPGRPMTYCRSPGIRRRWEATLLDHESEAEITSPERIWALLSRWITPQDADIERSVVYSFHSQIAKNWRQGSIMLAGDAAHLTPPFLGQGMCAGIRDAANLAWKLAAVISGQSDDTLLDSYQMEREPHARAYVETAMRIGGLINSLDRDTALKMAVDQKEGGARMRSIAPNLGHSPIVQPDDHAADHPVGQTCGQITIGPGGRTCDDLVGYRHMVVTREPVEFERGDVVGLCSRDYPALEQSLDALNAGVIWVRPDRYICAVAPTVDALAEPVRAFLKPKAHGSMLV